MSTKICSALQTRLLSSIAVGFNGRIHQPRVLRWKDDHPLTLGDARRLSSLSEYVRTTVETLERATSAPDCLRLRDGFPITDGLVPDERTPREPALSVQVASLPKPALGLLAKRQLGLRIPS